MSNPGSNQVLFENDGLSLRTLFTAPACGSVLINDRLVKDPWKPKADGRPECVCDNWRLTVFSAGCGAVGLRLTNVGPAPARLDHVVFARWRPADFAEPLHTWEFRELVHGASFTTMDCAVKPVGRPTASLAHCATSGMFTVYQREDGAAVLLGIIPPVGSSFSTFVTLHSEPHLEGNFGFECRHVFECVVDPGDSVQTSPIIALAGRGGVELMRAYGDLWHEALGRPILREPLVGWNSWDYYSGNVTEADVNENIEAVVKLRGDRPAVLVIDEGWEQQWGTWEPNAKFPSGLDGFCAKVRQAGLVPGIWTAPLLVNTYTPLFRDKPEWFASKADGQLQTDRYAYGPMAYLDVTNPDVIEHVQAIFRRLRSAGIEYFKVDFSHCILNAAKFADPTVGRNELIRRAFTAIREAIGPEAYLLSCGSPFESVIGLVDAARVTGDIHTYWGHLLVNAGEIAARWWMHRRLWNVDPDFLVVRGPDTASPPFAKRGPVRPHSSTDWWMTGRVFNQMEARVWALLVHLSGGDVICGDRLTSLEPNGMDMIRRVLTPRAEAAVPVDLFESEQVLPRIWIAQGNRDILVGLFNWLDTPASLCFDPKRWGLSGNPREFWTDQATTLPERMPRRSSLALVYSR